MIAGFCTTSPRLFEAHAHVRRRLGDLVSSRARDPLRDLLSRGQTLLEEIDRSNAEAKAAAPPAPAIEKEEPKEGEEKPTEESEEEVSMLAKMEGQAVKAQGYGLAKMGFGFVMGAFSQVEDAAMILSGFMPWSWDYASALVERLGWTAAERPIAVSLAFLAIQASERRNDAIVVREISRKDCEQRTFDRTHDGRTDERSARNFQ